VTIDEDEGEEEEHGKEVDLPVIETAKLCEYFHNLLSMYVIADDFDNGEPLIQLVQWHWQVFNEDTLSEASQKRLLEEIANADWDDDDGEFPVDADELYRPLGGMLHTTHRERWEQYCDDVRDDPDVLLPLHEGHEEDLAELEVTVPAGTIFFRARPGF
jgi:hypothetical protein